MGKQEQQTVTFGGACEHCYLTSLEEWRIRHARRVRTLDLLGYDVKRVTVDAVHERAGRLKIMVTIEARLVSQSDVDFYRYQRTGENAYLLVGGSKV